LGKGVFRRGIDFIKRQEKPFKVNLVRAAANTFLRHMTLQYQSIYILKLGASVFQLGLVNSISGILGTIISIPTGLLADKYGIRRMFLIGTPFMIIGSLIFALSHNWVMTILAMSLTLLANRFLSIACPMVCGSYLRNEERATGKQLCDTISAIPSLVAPMIATIIISEYGGLNAEGIRPLFFLQTLGFSLTLVWVYIFYRDTFTKRAPISSSIIGNMKKVFEKGTAIKAWLVCNFLTNMSFFLTSTYLPVFITEVKHGNEFVVGSIATVSLMVPILLGLVMGRFADYFGRKKTLYITSSLYALSFLIYIYANNITMLLIAGILQGFYTISVVTKGAITPELVPVSILGRWYGLLNLFAGLASITGPVLGGILWNSFSPNFLFFFLILNEVLTIIILRLAIPETLKMKQPLD
jgi:MFS family permease